MATKYFDDPSRAPKYDQVAACWVMSDQFKKELLAADGTSTQPSEKKDPTGYDLSGDKKAYDHPFMRDYI